MANKRSHTSKTVNWWHEGGDCCCAHCSFSSYTKGQTLPPLQLFLLRRVSELFEWCVCVQPLNRAYSRHGWMSAQIGCHVSPVPLYGSFMCGIIHKNVCLASIFTLASSYLNASFTVQSAMPLCASLLLLDWWKLISGMKSGFLYANNRTILFLEFLKGGSLVGEGNSV